MRATIRGSLRLTLVAAGCVAGSTVPSAPAHAQQFSAWPAVLRLSPVADSTVVQVVRVRNDGQSDLPLRFYAGDFEQGEDGAHRFLELGAHPRSCRSRIRVFPEGTLLRPGEAQDVRVSMAPGARACWAFVFAEGGATTGPGIRIGQRIAVMVFGLPPSVTLAGEVASVSATPVPDGVQVELAFRNTGDAPVRPMGRVEIRAPTGEGVATAEVRAFTVLPGDTRRVTVPVTAAIPPGRYLAIPLLDFDGDYLAGAQASFEVIPAGVARAGR